MYAIQGSIPKPESVKKGTSTASKYPFDQLKVGEVFFVPYADMQEGDTPQKFKARVQKSARNFAGRTATEELKKEFTVALMPEDDKPTADPVSGPGDTPRWFAGDIGVWRDK